MTRITHVLCPIDFCVFSRHAFDRALAVARTHGATVTALHVFPTPSAVAAGVVPFGPEGPGPFGRHHLDQEKLTQELAQFRVPGAAQTCRAPRHNTRAEVTISLPRAAV